MSANRKPLTANLSSKDALLEIGCEELPASFVPPALEEMEALVREALTSARLSFTEIRTLGTPRRLALLIDNVAEKQRDEIAEHKGPRADIAFRGGKPLEPALGFAKKHGVAVSALETRATPQGDYVFAVAKLPGLPAKQILPEIFKRVIEKIHFPKTMVWNASRFPFARPIRWLIALFGETRLKLTLAGVSSGNLTHLAIFGKKIRIRSPQGYVNALRNHCVIADPKERTEVIRKILSQAGHRQGLALREDPQLLEEVTFLCECPTAVSCRFSEAHLNLPEEVLAGVLRQQKFFPLEKAESPPSVWRRGRLSHHFIGIRDGISQNQEVVREGFERVVEARLADASFFFEKDQQVPLSARAEKLSQVAYQKNLGTLKDRTDRMRELAQYLSDELQLSQENKNALARAALLSKADLLCEMVREFPDLQGKIGGIYAKIQKEPKEAAQAISEQYLPAGSGGRIPVSLLGALLSLCEKMDALAGHFSIGLAATGSADPYGLRRAAVGVVRILMEKGISVSLFEFARRAHSLQPHPGQLEDFGRSDLWGFLEGRLKGVLCERGISFDEVEASFSGEREWHLPRLLARAQALHELRTHVDFEPIAIAFKRAANILQQAEKKGYVSPHPLRGFLPLPQGEREKYSPVNDGGRILPEGLKEEAEKALWQALEQEKKAVERHLTEGDFKAALSRLVQLRVPVDFFFDKVMVMAEDADLRRNRLSLLGEVVSLIRLVADFSKIQTSL